MKILALITARGGSKRLPGKNIRILGGRPLILWTIDVAKNNPEICDILVSTDDLNIANICKQSGAYVPWLRPAELATDTATSTAVAIHALDKYELEKGPVDGLLLLQPTSPFRTMESLNRGIELFKCSKYKTVLGVTPSYCHPMWALKMEGDYLVPYMQDHGLEMRSQDLPPSFFINGGFYLVSPAELRKFHSLIGGQSLPLIIKSARESLDIDTEEDFRLAELYIEDSLRQ